MKLAELTPKKGRGRKESSMKEQQGCLTAILTLFGCLWQVRQK